MGERGKRKGGRGKGKVEKRCLERIKKGRKEEREKESEEGRK